MQSDQSGVFLVQNISNGDVILVVEDEPLIMMDAIDILYEAGFRTVEATSAAEAIAILNGRHDVAAVFTDVQIVGEPDGLRLAHMVRERWPPVGLVVTSGRVFPAENELPVGGTFLPKPYSSETLVSKLRSVITEVAAQETE
ncbi:CheY-like chemotaxis protein [Bradyrhizobium japonicum USDA 38]|uniref:response regulator n=1 Tax=Bradyrhizobium japonicum TaxID=375 RepID=UPI001FD9C7C7|nr:response regulator [Bradyrhizobium japonicum]MCS3898416.1 CheY-like chemotaxis protein [Bradyrhizobium japonicum USDA 38]MCS3941469.1 CheY-like chemotaxis protein [Bradyrhizobium japonicum]